MKHCALALLLGLAPALPGQSAAPSPVPAGPGWTGVTHAEEIIKARQELMTNMEVLMAPLDTATVEPIKDLARLRENAELVSVMLTAFPHLFPPTTNVHDPRDPLTRTLALPTVWTAFESFMALSKASAAAAEAAADATDEATLKAAAVRLRASCDSCHAVYLRKYEPPKPKASDAEFDFEGALR
jgi:cytochrome c556